MFILRKWILLYFVLLVFTNSVIALGSGEAISDSHLQWNYTDQNGDRLVYKGTIEISVESQLILSDEFAVRRSADDYLVYLRFDIDIPESYRRTWGTGDSDLLIEIIDPETGNNLIEYFSPVFKFTYGSEIFNWRPVPLCQHRFRLELS
jgi:hypothetical protein